MRPIDKAGPRVYHLATALRSARAGRNGMTTDAVNAQIDEFAQVGTALLFDPPIHLPSRTAA